MTLTLYLKNPPVTINPKKLPKLPKLTKLPIEIQGEGPLSLLPTRLISLMPAGVLQILHDNLIALIPEIFIFFCQEELITLLRREKDYQNFMSHPFNQKLLALFVGLDSNTHSITLHHFATINNDVFTLSKLLSRTVDISSLIDRHGNSLVHLACSVSNDKYSTIFDLLLNVAPCKGVKKQQVKEIIKERVNAHNASDELPLHIACKTSNITAVKKLLHKGSDCDITDTEGYLPIHRALEKKYTPIVDLLSKHSNPEQLIKGKSLLAIAYEKGDAQLVNYLINKGLGINTVFQGTTILHKFCKNNEVQLVKKLLNAGVRQELMDATDSEGYTPFRIACAKNNYTIMISLFKNGSDIDFKIGGSTALHVACHSGLFKLVKFLLSHGANPNILDSKNNSCKMLAQQAHHHAINKLLPDGEDDKTITTSPSVCSISSVLEEEMEVSSIGSVSDITDID